MNWSGDDGNVVSFLHLGQQGRRPLLLLVRLLHHEEEHAHDHHHYQPEQQIVAQQERPQCLGNGHRVLD